MLAIDEYAVKSLEAIEAKESERSVFSVILFPFGAPSNSKSQLIDTFNQAAEVMEMQLKRLVRFCLSKQTSDQQFVRLTWPLQPRLI